MKSYKKTYSYIVEWRNIYGELHREDGPAITRNTGRKSWFLNDSQYNEKDYKLEIVKRNLEKIIQEFLDF